MSATSAACRSRPGAAAGCAGRAAHASSLSSDARIERAQRVRDGRRRDRAGPSGWRSGRGGRMEAARRRRRPRLDRRRRGETLKNQRTKAVDLGGEGGHVEVSWVHTVRAAARMREAAESARARRTPPTRALAGARFPTGPVGAVAWRRQRVAWRNFPTGSERPMELLSMLIRIGFDIELSVATPMALIYLLRVHPSRRDDLVAPENLQISGGLAARGIHRQLRQPLRPRQRAGRHERRCASPTTR